MAENWPDRWGERADADAGGRDSREIGQRARFDSWSSTKQAIKNPPQAVRKHLGGY